MQRIYQNFFFILIILFTGHSATAQDSLPTSVNPRLVTIFDTKIPKEYTIGGIIVTGTKNRNKAQGFVRGQQK